MLQIVASLIGDARVIIYDPSQCNLKFYSNDHCHYDHKLRLYCQYDRKL
jgi:hypothetical protein